AVLAAVGVYDLFQRRHSVLRTYPMLGTCAAVRLGGRQSRFVRPRHPISRSVMTTGASTIVTALADLGVHQVWGVVGAALNPITEAIRLDDRIEWVGVRHEEVAAFAAGAQAQLNGTLGVCMGTVGPGSVHLLNGLYDAKKSHAPVLAICGQVPTSEIGSNFFQEVDNNALFADVSVFHATVTAGSQMPYLLEQAVNAAFAKRGVA